MFQRDLIAVAVALLFIPFGVSAKDRPITWNKPQVSYERYRADADECANTSRYVAVHVKPDTLARLNEASIATLIQLAASFDLTSPTSTGAAGYLTSMDSFKSEKEIAQRSQNNGSRYTSMVRRDVQDELQVVLEKCLVERGYQKFQLTDEQTRHLSTLKHHSPERDTYLWSLGGLEEPSHP